MATIGSVQGLSNGASLSGTTTQRLLHSQGVMVCCGIEIENWTNRPLVDPKFRSVWGNVAVPPRSVLPGLREVMIGVKTDFSFTGTTGTVSWLVEGTKRRVVVMWSAPFSLNYYDNTLSVGITEEGVDDPMDQQTFYCPMYDTAGPLINGLKFSTAKFKKGFPNPAINVSRGGLHVQGTMNSMRHAIATVIVRPAAADGAGLDS